MPIPWTVIFPLEFMAEQNFLKLLAEIEHVGVWLSILAWFSVAAGVVIMARVLRHERCRGVWRAAVIVGAVALGANLADYFVTLSVTPDLSLEANPLGRMVLERYGLQVAKWYGLTGKILVSILAGQMFAFYLANRERLFPTEARSFSEFLFRMGNRSKTSCERFVAFFTAFCFFFAGIQLFYFYVAYLNWLVRSELRSRLLSAPVTLCVLLISLAIVFVAVTYRGYVALSAGDEKIA